MRVTKSPQSCLVVETDAARIAIDPGTFVTARHDLAELGGIEVAAIHITGPSISFHDGYRFVRRLGAERIVPVHYDGFIADPEHFARVCDLAEVQVLANAQTLDLATA